MDPQEELADLTRRAAGGASEAMAQLLDRHRVEVTTFVYHQMSPSLRQEVDPEDIVQEVSLSCLRSFIEVDWQKLGLLEWVFSVARRRVIDAARQYKSAEKRDLRREVPLQAGKSEGGAELIQLLIASITTPSQAFSRDQREFRVREALERLPPESREALRLRYLEQLASKEIARRLGKTDGAVRVLLTRSLHKLQELLENGGL